MATEYNVEHLTKLGQLKLLAEKLKTELGNYAKTETIDATYAKKSEISDMETKTNAAKTYAAKTEIADMETKTNAKATYAAKTELEDYAKKTDIASVYKPAGSVAFADLPKSPTAADAGKVYNVTNDFTTDTKFIDGETGKKYPAGTNVVVVEVGDSSKSYKYDVLSGIVDLSGYTTTEQLTSELANYASKTEFTALQTTVNGLDNTYATDAELSAAISGLSATYQPKGEYATKTDLAGKLDSNALDDYETAAEAAGKYQPKGDYLTDADLTGYVQGEIADDSDVQAMLEEVFSAS